MVNGLKDDLSPIPVPCLLNYFHPLCLQGIMNVCDVKRFSTLCSLGARRKILRMCLLMSYLFLLNRKDNEGGSPILMEMLIKAGNKEKGVKRSSSETGVRVAWCFKFNTLHAPLYLALPPDTISWLHLTERSHNIFSDVQSSLAI
ncbi:hypothetical protein M9H77_00475 [Catharanthus roseus]|nr:hypothetical protein M9H77_00475 [Catharanthus roseus]